MNQCSFCEEETNNPYYSMCLTCRTNVTVIVAALQYYADPSNYEELHSGRTNIIIDGGSLAREAIEASKDFL